MSMTQRAFPVQHSTDGRWLSAPHEALQGMTMRQYYKAAAIAGIMRDTRYALAGIESNCAYEIARYAGVIADALLAEDKHKHTEGGR